MDAGKPRIAFLTAGAAQMFCGSCLRDNALAAALKRRGCDILLIPTYTPIRTDERDESIDQVFFGGINVYLQQKFGFFRRLPRFLDRALDAPWLIRRATSRGIDTDAAQLGDLTLSMLEGERGRQAKEILRLTDWLKGEVKPDLVNLTNILIAGCAPALRRELGVPVLVNLQGDDLFLEGLPESHRSAALWQIRRLIPSIDGFVAFNRFYADFMSEYLEIPRDRIHLVPLGLNLDDFSNHHPERPANDRPTVGYFARVCPEKGFHVLMEAFLRLRGMPGMEKARLRAAGWLDERHRGFLEQQLEKARRAGAGADVEYAGVLDRRQKIDFLRGLDVFSVPTVYREAKGLFVLEAWAAGVPVVQPAHGAFPEMVEASGGGCLVAPDDPETLAHRLHQLLRDEPLRRELGERGRRAVARDFSAEKMAERTLAVYRRFVAPSGRS